MKKVVLAYSGGLDTSVAVTWLTVQGWEVVAVAVDVGQPGDLKGAVDQSSAGHLQAIVDAGAIQLGQLLVSEEVGEALPVGGPAKQARSATNPPPQRRHGIADRGDEHEEDARDQARLH